MYPELNKSYLCECRIRYIARKRTMETTKLLILRYKRYHNCTKKISSVRRRMIYGNKYLLSKPSIEEKSQNIFPNHKCNNSLWLYCKIDVKRCISKLVHVSFVKCIWGYEDKKAIKFHLISIILDNYDAQFQLIWLMIDK